MPSVIIKSKGGSTLATLKVDSSVRAECEMRVDEREREREEKLFSLASVCAMVFLFLSGAPLSPVLFSPRFRTLTSTCRSPKRHEAMLQPRSCTQSHNQIERAQGRARIRDSKRLQILLCQPHRVSFSFFSFFVFDLLLLRPLSFKLTAPSLLSFLSLHHHLLLLQATVDDLKAAFAAAKPKFYPSRQRFTLPLQPGERKPVALASGKKLSDFGVRDGTELTFKDLGPQIGYSTVFFWEYFGPALVYALVYFFPEFVYPWAVSTSRWGGSSSGIPEKSQVQKLALGYWTFHYAKRIFETFFVHR
jgi:hypothetical protein